MPYSTACATPLSNFEAAQNFHEHTSDPAIVVAFPLEHDPGACRGWLDWLVLVPMRKHFFFGIFAEVSFVAWTTTPWTLPSNLALCVHPDMVYVQVQDLKTCKVCLFLFFRQYLIRRLCSLCMHACCDCAALHSG